ncbi:MAG: hypothetical protein C0608_09950 [Deltaproteobacteria bacterium]|nr:MAG: hypothetical protein C0608_09950 [Deltaproteobacteria bacterium]
MKIKDVLIHHGGRPMPTSSIDDAVDDVIRKLVMSPDSRVVYVLDGEGRLAGTISLTSLLRHAYPHNYQAQVHSRGILRKITAGTAGELMDSTSIFAKMDDDVEDILAVMGSGDVKEMAVVDVDGRVKDYVTAVDLLCCHHLSGELHNGK